jgi:hypothetical protein
MNLGCLYSPKCVEGEFCELRLLGILGTSALRSSKKFTFQEFSEVNLQHYA